jgi:hypothetical protein
MTKKKRLKIRLSNIEDKISKLEQLTRQICPHKEKDLYIKQLLYTSSNGTVVKEVFYLKCKVCDYTIKEVKGDCEEIKDYRRIAITQRYRGGWGW